MRIEINMGEQTYALTTEHPSSSYGMPVLVDAAGRAYAPWDNVIDNRDARMGSGESYHWQMTARAVAAYARDDHPNDAAILELVRSFESVPMPSRG